MGFRRSIASLMLLVTALASLSGPTIASASAGRVPGYAAVPGSARQAPVALTSSVIVRGDKTVNAASADLDAVAAHRYIVTYTGAVADVAATTDTLAAALGFTPSIIYTARVRGFAATLTDQQLAKLKARADVASVEPDEVIPAPRAYGMPFGVQRVGALANATARINGADERVNADVAVIDTGVDTSHPDLNVQAIYDCTGEDSNALDDVGHGTHVAGTIGALDDGFGVTGVAPGARIWDIKIFTAEGGLVSWAICGLEVAADYGSAIDVANMSWGWYDSDPDGACSDTSIHQAICDAYNAGITLVNAAGNDDVDAADSVPTTFSQVIAVSAIADSDGMPGGRGGALDWGCDDCFATFSNFGADIDIAAPGVDVLSTCPLYLDCNAAYGLAVESGTSMASPHVAGAAALYIARQGRVGPANVRAALIANSDPGTIPGDPDSHHEPVLYIGDLAPACTVNPTAAAPKTSITLSCTKFRASEPVTVYQDSSSGLRLGSFTASARGNGTLTIPAPTTTRGLHNLVAKGKYSRRSTTAALRIQGTIKLTPSSGANGSSVTVSVSGFAASESVTIAYDPGTTSAKTLKSGVTTASNGTGAFGVTIPSTATVGKHKIEAKGTKGSKVTATFTVTSSTASVAEAGATPSPSATATVAPDKTATPTPVATEPAEPTATATDTATATPEPTIAPSPTAAPTDEPTSTPTAEPAPTDVAAADSANVSGDPTETP